MYAQSVVIKQVSMLVCLIGCTFIIFSPEWRELVAASYGTTEDVDVVAAPDDAEPDETLEKQEEAIENRLEELRDDEFMDLPRWGLFATAVYGEKERDTRRELGYDGKLKGLTVGTDYRINRDLVVGAAVSAFSEESELLENAGDIDITSRSLSLYGGYTPTPRSYIDFLIGYTDMDFDSVRNARDIAIGSEYGGYATQAALNFGYSMNRGALSIGPLLELSYSRTVNDDKIEKEGGDLAVRAEGKKSSSLLAKIGATANYAMSFGWGVMSPYAGLFYQHEFLNDAVELTSTVISSGATSTFLTDDPDRHTYIGRLGVSAALANDFNFFVGYEQLLSHEYLQRRNFNVGARIAF